MTLIDAICEGRAFSRGWKTPNDRFPLPVVQSLTQFNLKFVVLFLFISDHHLSNKGDEQLEVEQNCCVEPWESAVPPGLRLWIWVSELMETAVFLHKNLQGGCALGNGHRGVIIGNPCCSGSGRLSLTEGCPRARLGVRRGRSGPRDTCQTLGKPLICPVTVWCRQVSLSRETVLQCREGSPEVFREAV